METVKIADLHRWAKGVHDYARGEGEVTRKTALTAVGNLLHSAETAILCTKKYEAYDFFPIVTKLSRALNEEALYPDRRLSLRIAQTMRIYLELTSHRLQADEGNAASLGPLKETLVSRLKTRLEQAEMCDNLTLTFELLRFREAAKLLDGGDELFTVELAVQIVKASVALAKEHNPSEFIAIFGDLRKKMHATWYPFSFECATVGRIARENEKIFNDFNARITEFVKQKVSLFKKDTSKQYGLMAAIATLADCAEESTNGNLRLRAVKRLGSLSQLKHRKIRYRNVRACALEHLSFLRKHPDKEVGKQAQVELERARQEDADKIGALGVLRPPIATPTGEVNQLLKPSFVIDIEYLREQVGKVLENQQKLLALPEVEVKVIEESTDPFQPVWNLLEDCENWKEPHLETMQVVGQVALHPESSSFLKQLASKGFNFDQVKGDFNLLCALISAQEHDAMVRLLDAGANPNVSLSIGSATTNPLVLAAVTNDERTIRILMERGATSGLQKAISVALLGRNTRLISSFAQGGADMNQPLRVANQTNNDPVTLTPLNAAIVLRDPTLMECLLTHGADPNLISGTSSPLMLSVVIGNVELARVLMRHGAEPDLPVGTSGTPLAWAIRTGNFRLTEAMLMLGGDPNQTARGVPILLDAWSGGHTKIVHCLLKHGADPNVSIPHQSDGDAGRIPFFCAVTLRGSLADMEIFLKHGADPNATGRDGTRILQAALVGGLYEKAACLLRFGANPKIQFHGTPLLDIMVDRNDQRAAVMLLRAGGTGSKAFQARATLWHVAELNDD